MSTKLSDVIDDVVSKLDSAVYSLEAVGDKVSAAADKMAESIIKLERICNRTQGSVLSQCDEGPDEADGPPKQLPPPWFLKDRDGE